MASNQEPIVLYDIASAEPLRTFAPNPWKARYALNYKGLSYRTEWIDMPAITALREKLGVPANRTLPDGTPYHTLPVIQDTSTGKVIGDTFEIAQYLDKTYPALPRLITPNATGLTAALNANIDTLFTKHFPLVEKMPFDPRIAAEVGEIFAKRARAIGVADISLSPEAREALFVQFENALGELAKAYYHVGGTTDHFWSKTGTAPAQAQRSERRSQAAFLDGDQPTYADFIIDAWFAAFEATMKAEDWQRIMRFQNGHWARLHDALAPYRTIR